MRTNRWVWLAIVVVSGMLQVQSPIPAAAQGSPFGRWSDPIYTWSGTTVCQRNGAGTTTQWPDGQYPLQNGNQIWTTADHTVSVAMSGTITATFVWLDANGVPTLTNPPPPSVIYINQTGNAGWSVTIQDGSATVTSHSASDGLGHQENLAPDGLSGTSSGLKVMAPSAVAIENGEAVAHASCSPQVNAALNVSGDGFVTAHVLYSATVYAPADDYDFTGYPHPPPAGTTGYAQKAANKQGALSDGTKYYVTGRVHNNNTAMQALEQLKQDGVFFVFGHGGYRGGDFNGDTSIKPMQTFWNGTTWSYMVQTTQGKNDMINTYHVDSTNIVCLDEATVTNPGDPTAYPLCLRNVILAVFEGCFTAIDDRGWGTPADAVVARGARCALGFTVEILSHYKDQNTGEFVNGAEEWSDRFWKELASGKTVQKAAEDAANITKLRMGLANYRIVPGLAGQKLKISPARYGYQLP